ncbi:hypothetical protein B4166_2807 [Caldibacillus thermoamylovorans]|uniref:Integrase catalytic domain-containing protein n=1 Tax=Caldibacillus thermoamylovorans TaxID=35841 RepID=A0ABD4A830_9BACI|nr:hypothetical protein B4166_2807 [Caldibacillus thermoamylovorans]KIO72579.1 hypothetical protein B4167_2967 [Caldibacillus thermoamylovorans]
MESLEELNERFWRWLEEDYHRRTHASLDGKTPHDSQLESITFLEDTSILDSIFMKRECLWQLIFVVFGKHEYA